MKHGRVLILLVAVLVLGISGIALAQVSAQRSGDTLTITGTDGADVVTLEVVPGVADPAVPFFAVSDPNGVTSVPPGCFRFDANTIHCPVSLIKHFVFDFGAGNDKLIIEADGVFSLTADGGPGSDALEGGPRGDHLAGGAGGDVERGGAGNEVVSGGGGNDKENGGPGRDVVTGGTGRDQLDGGTGRDRCNGGPGDDTDRRCEIGVNY